MSNDDTVTTYTLIVNGDTNGNSVCDALDGMFAELVVSGNMTPSSTEQRYYDVNKDGVVNEADRQLIMERAVGK